MSALKVTLPGSTIPAMGLQVSFLAPCGCNEITHLVIDNVDYSLVDAMGNTIAGNAGVWASGAVVSVLLDTANNRAFLLNAAALSNVVPIDKGGTGGTTVAEARNNLGLGNTDGPLPIENGGTGASTVAEARANLGLGNDEGPLAIENGGTGGSTVAEARNNLGLGNTDGPLPVENGGTGASTVEDAVVALGLYKPFASAKGSSDNLSLPKGTIVKIPLSTWLTRSGDDLTFSADGGIVMPRDGTIMVSASIYFTNVQDGNFGVYVLKNNDNDNQVAGQIIYVAAVAGVGIPTTIVDVEAGDVITLHGRSIDNAGTCMPSASKTYLVVAYL